MKKLFSFLIGAMIMATSLSAEDIIDHLIKQVDLMAAERVPTASEGVHDLLTELQANSQVVRTGTDKQNRMVFVSAQAFIEEVLTELYETGDITDLVGVTHTPTPPTPLCTDVDGKLTVEIDDNLEEVTVNEHAHIVKTYLEKGGRLYAAYVNPLPEGQDTFKQTCKDYSRLTDIPFNYKGDLPANMVGATYFFRDRSDKAHCFYIRAPQANAATDDYVWILGMGALTHPKIKENSETITGFLAEHAGLDLQGHLR